MSDRLSAFLEGTKNAEYIKEKKKIKMEYPLEI